MVNKKAYLKTLEALIAIAIFLIFLTTALIMNQPEKNEPSTPQDIKLIQDTIFNKIQTEQSIRDCLITDNNVCLEGVIDTVIIDSLDYGIQICTDAPNCLVSDLILPTDKTIYADSLIIKEQGTTAILRLYLWRKLE
jgi:hypothetical protein